LSIGISYNANIKLAKDTVKQIINSHNKVIADKGITVEVSELADSSVNFVIRMWTKTSDYWDVFFYMNEKIKEEFDKKGIEIPFPQLDVHLNKNV
ncbi:mechanosensitive ion channel, partial [candidate division WOR-3 bacterium]|nr:mechanosensitive ion channel [candidate division WOR-3 bacterium]